MLQRQWLRRLLLTTASLLVIWNALSLAQYRLGLVPMGEALTWRQMTIGRIEVPWLLLRRWL